MSPTPFRSYVSVTSRGRLTADDSTQVASVFFGMGTILAFSATFTFLVDAYRPVAASAMALNSCMRASLAAGFPLFTGQSLSPVHPQQPLTRFPQLNFSQHWVNTLLPRRVIRFVLTRLCRNAIRTPAVRGVDADSIPGSLLLFLPSRSEAAEEIKVCESGLSCCNAIPYLIDPLRITSENSQRDNFSLCSPAV